MDGWRLGAKGWDAVRQAEPDVTQRRCAKTAKPGGDGPGFAEKQAAANYSAATRSSVGTRLFEGEECSTQEMKLRVLSTTSWR